MTDGTGDHDVNQSKSDSERKVPSFLSCVKAKRGEQIIVKVEEDYQKRRKDQEDGKGRVMEERIQSMHDTCIYKISTMN